MLVQKTAHGQGSPFIRGFTGFHTLLMVDGIRLNHSAFRSGPNQYWASVDPLSIGRVEVVKGPSSVLYGSDAVGGTVHVITESVARGSDEFELSPQTYLRFGEAEDSRVGRFSLTGGTDSFGFLAAASLRDFGDVESGSGLQPNTGYDEFDGDLKLEFLPRSDSRLVVAYQTVNQDDVPRTHKTIFAQSFAGTTVGSERRRDLDQDRDLFYVQYHMQDLGRFVTRAKFSLSYHQHDEQRDRLRAVGRGGDVQGFSLNTFGAWGQFESPTASGHLTYGFEYYRDDVDSFKRRFDDAGNLTRVEIQGPVADDAAYEMLGVYLQNEIPLGKKLNLTLGARYTHAAADADRVDVGGIETSLKDSWNDIVGSARVIYTFNDAVTGFFGASQGFRAPNLADLTKLDDTSAVEVPSPGLEPEHFYAFELGAKVRRDRWRGQVAVWYTAIDDLIVQSPTGVLVGGTPEVRKDNIGDGFARGIEVEGSVSPRRGWWVFGNFTWMDGEVDQLDGSQGFTAVRAPLSRVMPRTGNVGVRRHLNRFWIEGLVTAVDNQDELALRDVTDTERIPPGGTPGYTTYTLRGGVTLRRAFEVGVAVENLTDKNYRVHGSGQNEPGMNLVLSLNATF